MANNNKLLSSLKIMMAQLKAVKSLTGKELCIEYGVSESKLKNIKNESRSMDIDFYKAIRQRFIDEGLDLSLISEPELNSHNNLKDGEILRKLLIDRGLKEEDIAEKFGVSKRQVYRYYETETLSNSVKKKFIDHYGLSLDNSIITTGRPENPKKPISLSEKTLYDELLSYKTKEIEDLKKMVSTQKEDEELSFSSRVEKVFSESKSISTQLAGKIHRHDNNILDKLDARMLALESRIDKLAKTKSTK